MCLGLNQPSINFLCPDGNDGQISALLSTQFVWTLGDVSVQERMVIVQSKMRLSVLGGWCWV